MQRIKATARKEFLHIPCQLHKLFESFLDSFFLFLLASLYYILILL